MNVLGFLHNLLMKSSAIKHKARLNSVLTTVSSLFRGGKLSLTSLGRHKEGKAKVKSKIKSVDYLLNNGQLHHERTAIYEALMQKTLAGMLEINILVDWSPCITHENQILKASVVYKGRAMTLYEEVHPEKKLGNYDVHERFLDKLKKMIKAPGRVTVITDAGFRSEWFSLVEKMGWDFVGRVRSNIQIKKMGSENENWRGCISEYEYATGTPSYRGEIILSKERKLPCFMYLYKEPARTKNKVKRKKKHDTMTKAYRKSAHDPWLLVSSRNDGENSALMIILLYKKRMKIEHEFRDTKDVQWGIGLSFSGTSDPQRLQILLLLGWLALFLLWLIGFMTELKKEHYAYQANTVKTHRVLSLVFLGMQVILHDPKSITLQNLTYAFENRE